MREFFFILLFFSLRPMTAVCQGQDKSPDLITIKVIRIDKGDEKTTGPIQKYIYDEYGLVQLVESRLLYPFNHHDDSSWIAKFYYDDLNRLTLEEVFNAERPQQPVFSTKFNYSNVCRKAISKDVRKEKWLYTMQRCKENKQQKTELEIIGNNLSPWNFWFGEGWTFHWQFDEVGRPTSAKVKGPDQIKISYSMTRTETEVKIIKKMNVGNEPAKSSIQIRQHDKDGKLVSICFLDKNDEAGVFIAYDDNGFLKEIKHSGNWVDTREKTWSKLIFIYDIASGFLQRPILMRNLAKTINQELIEYYHPSLFGIPFNPVFDDHRMFLKNQG